MKLPFYFSRNDRPVKVFATPDGGLDVQALDPRTGEFVRELEFLADHSSGKEDVMTLTEEEFEELVRWHRRNREERPKAAKE